MAQMFEDNLTFLQSSTEKLSHFLENEIHLLSIKKKKLDVQHTVAFCQKHSDQLLQNVQEGIQNDKWAFREI